MVKDFPKNSDSSIYKARLKEQDLASQEKLQEIQGAADELARQAIIDKLKQAEVEYEKLKLELEQEASDGVNNLLSYVELSAAENEDNFTSGIDGLLAKLFKFFNFMDSELGVETDPQVYNMIKEREKKQVWIAAVIKFLRDKFNKLVKAIFSRDLSFQQKIDKEIKELYERLFSGSLSQEEEAAILERLEALRDLKLKLQIFVVGSIIAMFSELFSAELTASVETTKEEGKEKAPAKEATKEVRENLEIKVDAKEKPQLKYDVIPAFDAESWLKKPITLTKQEFDILQDPIKKMVELPPKPAINNENSGVPKQEVKERQGNENKQAELKVAGHQSEAPKQSGTNTAGMGQGMKGAQKCNSSRTRRKEFKKDPNKSTQGSIYNGNVPGQSAQVPTNRRTTEQSIKSSVADCGFDFTKIGNWNGAEHGFMGDVQENPRSKVTDVVEKRVGGQSVEKARSRE